MANGLFQPGAPFGPVTPGGSGFANPLAQLAFGLGQGQPLQALQGLAQQQQAGAQIAMAQERLRVEMEARRAEQVRREGLSRAAGGLVRTSPLFSALAPDVGAQMAQYAPESVLQLGLAGLAPKEAKRTPAMIEAQTLYPTDPAAQARYIEEARLKPESVINVGGEFKTPQGATPVLDKAGNVIGVEYAPGTKEYETRKSAFNKVQSFVNRLNSLAERMKDPTQGPAFFGEEAAALQTEVDALRLLAKSPEFENLGVLSGPDLEILASLIPDPTRLMNLRNIAQEYGLSDALSRQFSTYAGVIGERLQNLPDYERFVRESEQPAPTTAPARPADTGVEPSSAAFERTLGASPPPRGSASDQPPRARFVREDGTVLVKQPNGQWTPER